MNVHVSEHVRGGACAGDGARGCGKGCSGNGNWGGAAARGPTTRTRALHSSPMLRAPPRTGLGVDRRARGRGQGEWGSGGRAQRNVGFSFRILLPSVPPNGNGEGRVQTGRPELGGGVDRCAPPYCTLRQGDNDTLTMSEAGLCVLGGKQLAGTFFANAGRETLPTRASYVLVEPVLARSPRVLSRVRSLSA